MQHPASIVLAAIARFLVDWRIVWYSEPLTVYYLTTLCMLISAAFLSTQIDRPRTPAMGIGSVKIYALNAALRTVTLHYLGMAIAFPVFYPGTRVLDEVCQYHDVFLRQPTILEPCGGEFLRLWVLELIESGGRRRVLDLQIAALLTSIFILGVAIFVVGLCVGPREKQRQEAALEDGKTVTKEPVEGKLPV